MTTISPARADEILDALRRGTVPESALEAFAVGLDPYRDTLLAAEKEDFYLNSGLIL